MPRVRQDIRPPNTLGERIRYQRQAVGLTVTQLAKLLGVNRNTIANYESGKTEPGANDLVRLADALGCDITDLLSETARLGAPRFAFRAHSVLHKDPHITVMARKYLRAYMEIEEIMGTRLALRLPQFPLDLGDPHPTRWIEMAADKVRERCGMRDCGPENIAYVLESLGIRCLFFHYKGKGLDGLSALQDDMPLVMLRDPDTLIERTIFSGAHELGHLVLHPHLFTTDGAGEGNERDYEKEAQQFAGYFLVPTDDLVYMWEEEHLHRLAPVHALLLLKRAFRVSFWCLHQRIEQAGLAQVDYPRLVADVKRLLGIHGRATMADLEPEPLPSAMLRRSTRFERLVYSAFIQEKLGVAKVAELFQITVEEAKELTTAWMAPDHALVE
jgi:Zn-dependent peptidase ImmA (M78 family)/transcriptional regulator with XRE-family HTH domain